MYHFITSGDQYSWFGITTNTVFSSLITLLVVFLSQYLIRRNDRKKDVTRLLKLKQFYLSILKLVVERSKTQSQSFREFAASLHQKTDEDFKLDIAPDPYYVILNQVPQTDAFEIFVDSGLGDIATKSNQFGLMHNSLAAINSVRKRAELQFERFVNEYNQKGKYYEESVNTVLSQFDSIHLLYTSDVLSKAPFSDMTKIIETWSHLENRQEPFVIRPQLIEPLLELARRHLEVPFAVSLLRPLIACSHAIDHISDKKKSYSKDFQFMADNLNDSRELIDKFILNQSK